MGIFKKIAGGLGIGAAGRAVRGITGQTAARSARRAGEAQARAITQGFEAQRRQIPGALQALTQQTLEAQEELRPFTGPGATAAQRMQQLAGQPMPAYAPTTYQAPTAEELAESPAVAFRMQQAQRAAERGAAARGGLFGGGHQRQLAEYMQGLASQEYEAEAARRMREAEFAERQAQFAPQMALQQRAAQAAELGTLGGMGLQAAGQLGGIRERFGQQMAGIRTGSGAAQAAALQSAGQARASGVLAGQQARQAGLGQLMGLAGTLGSAYMLGPGGAALGGRLLGGTA